MSAAREALFAWMERRLTAESRDWFAARVAEIGAGVSHDHFARLISLASRFAPRGALAPTSEELSAAEAVLPGWNPERWSALDAARVALVLARTDLARPEGLEALEEAFRYADDRELCALYRSLALLPDGARVARRAAEGCRTNIVPVFEAVACDNPYPVTHFDDVAWRQLCIKAVFMDAPLWRVHGLDRRLSPELARMALDLADERRSAGRPVQHELWLCLGGYGGARGIESLEREMASENTLGRRAAAIALARAGATERLREVAEGDPDPAVRASAQRALEGACDSQAFRALDHRGR